MSTGRRLAKRSIIGTKVCAPGPDGLWYSGVIQDVKTPPTATITSASCSSVSVSASSSSSSSLSSLSDSPNGTNITADTKYIVRFDFKTQSMQSSLDGSPASKSVIMEARRAANAHISPTQTLRRNAMIKEFRESDLIGPGFRSILGIQLQPGQRVFLTYNGRETSGDVLSHDANKDEVVVKIMATGTEDPIELKKRLEEVRLLESRRSARLADQERDTDFARLADMGSGDRRRTTSHSIDVPSSLTPSHNPRKRPPPYTHDCTSGQCKEEMDECNAALILMNLSNSPTSPKNAEKWLGSSPGSSSASWSSGSSSPPLSDDGHALNTSAILNDATARIRTTSVSTSDEGIVVDYKDNKDYKTPRKKKANKSRFLCTWKGCKFIESTPLKIERHIRTVHLGNKKARRSVDYDGSCSENDHEEEFYYTEIEDDDDEGKAPSPTSPPTLSHRDMARPPHEDPEYQRQIVKQGRASQHQQQLQQQHHHTSKTIYQSGSYISTNSQQQQHHAQSNCMSASPLAHHNYTWPSSTTTVAAPTSSTSAAPTTAPQSHSAQQQQQQQFSPASLIRHARASPRPSQSAAPYPSPPYAHHNQQQQQQHHHQHHNYSSPHASVSNSNGGSGSGSGSSNTNHCAPIIHGNSSANNMLQQLSQQNVTVTARHSGIGSSSSSGNHSQQQHQVPAVTITPNYHPQTQPPHPNSHQQHHHQTQQQSQSQPQPQPPQQHMRGHHQTPHSTTASTIVALQQHAHAAPTHTHQQHPQHAAVQHTVTAAAKATPNSPNRRTRGENKKCRKVYGMERREQWCTQCRWKKACTRFGD